MFSTPDIFFFIFILSSLNIPFGMLMPGRHGYSQGAGWVSDGSSSTLPQSISYSTRSGNIPLEYKASLSIEFTEGFESGVGDEFTAYITNDGGSGNGVDGSEGMYRYGFNGKENDNEIKGEGNQQDYGMRIYDPRLGRFLSVDPLTTSYPWYTPYQYAGNIPTTMIDLDGLEEVSPSIHYDPITGTGSASYPKLSKSEWKLSDRSSASGSFASATRHNTNTLNSGVYAPVNQIHKYYVWAAREVDKTKANIKFFHAARDVTSRTGVDGAYTYSELVGLSKKGRQSLAEVNAAILI